MLVILSLLLFVHHAISLTVKYEPDLIAMELVTATDTEQNASFDCWINAVMSLELETLTLPYADNMQLSYGTNFCSVLAKNQQKALAIELTKCHLEGSGRSRLPDVCFINGVSNGLNGIGIQQCLSNLSQEGFIVYTQFFMHTEEACSKLTNELSIMRKNQSILRFEESARMIDEKIQESITLQETIIHGMIEQSEYMSQQQDASKQAKDELNHMIQGVLSQNEIIDEQKQILVSVNEIYHQSGINEVMRNFSELRKLPVQIFRMFWRYSRILMGLLVLLMLSRYRLTLFILSMSTLEITAEYAAFRLHSEGLITGPEHDFCISFLRQYDVPLYIIAISLSFLSSYILNGKQTKQEAAPITEVELDAVIKTIEKQLIAEEKARRKERKQFREQILSLQQQLNNSPRAFTPSPHGSNHTTPAQNQVRMRNMNQTSTFVTPYIHRDPNTNVSISDNNGNNVVMASPLTSPESRSHGIRKQELSSETPLIQMPNRYKRKAYDTSTMSHSDESSLGDESRNETHKKHKSKS